MANNIRFNIKNKISQVTDQYGNLISKEEWLRQKGNKNLRRGLRKATSVQKETPGIARNKEE